MEPKRYRMIACEILYREVCFCAALSKNIIDITFMGKSLHDMGAKGMSQKLREEINTTPDGKYDAILLAYGLCNNGITGIEAKTAMVIPRAHDCITLMLGSREKYMKYHSENARSYFMSTGWLERDSMKGGSEEGIPSQLGMNKTYREYAEQYGEENAAYLMEMLGDWTSNYDKYTYIDIGFGDFSHYAEKTRQDAETKNWRFEELKGNVSLLRKLCDGDWNPDEFLVVPPGTSVKAVLGDEIISCGC